MSTGTRENTRIRALERIADILRIHSLEMTAMAGSGHPTSCLSCAEIMSVLFFEIMENGPPGRLGGEGDEFILSKGHAAPILYAALAEKGVLPRDSLPSLRELDSPLEGHPVPRVPGVRVATGSLGQGLAAAIGLALAVKKSGGCQRVFVLLGDGEMAEGSVLEAMSFAPSLRLSNLYAVADVNRLGQSGPTLFDGNLDAYRRQSEAFGWDTAVVDGHSVLDLLEVLGRSRPGRKPQDGPGSDG
jgi:transketolase